nr:MAG TPA: hypothetical protein [Caudoviricetes sp.]
MIRDNTALIFYKKYIKMFERFYLPLFFIVKKGVNNGSVN